MEENKNWWSSLNPFSKNKSAKEQSLAKEPKGIDDTPDINSPGFPKKRISLPDSGNGYGFLSGLYHSENSFDSHFPENLRKVIKQIRALSVNNEDVSQVISNIVALANTGHQIKFDQSVPAEQALKMRNHLQNQRKFWATGQAGIHGPVNKMFAQCFIGGAVSNEWVPNKKLTGVESIVFVNPEDVYFELDARGTEYLPYQKVKSLITDKNSDPLKIGFKKLNTHTYKYFALNGDTDIPNGFPPYASVIERIKSQQNMFKNIDFIADELSILGFLELLMDKPDQLDGESDVAYERRLETFLNKAKSNLKGGLKEGLVAGYKDDHTFKLNNITKDFQGAESLFKLNEQQIFSALKHDPTLAGRDYNTSEAQINVIFIKMLSELRNVQQLVKENLEFGYRLELLLAGYSFNHLTVEFNRSTIQDDLKYQQAQEIQLRNVKDKFLLGIINQNQAAIELGYNEPANAPLVDANTLAGKSANAPEKKTETNKKKKANQKENKKKNKPVDKQYK